VQGYTSEKPISFTIAWDIDRRIMWGWLESGHRTVQGQEDPVGPQLKHNKIQN